MHPDVQPYIRFTGRARLEKSVNSLLGFVEGIAIDGRITQGEVAMLNAWLAEHEHLKTCWPYDEVEGITTKVMSDQRIDESEHRLLVAFFSEFLAMLDERTVVAPLIAEGESLAIGALCSVMPNIRFPGS